MKRYIRASKYYYPDDLLTSYDFQKYIEKRMKEGASKDEIDYLWSECNLTAENLAKAADRSGWSEMMTDRYSVQSSSDIDDDDFILPSDPEMDEAYAKYRSVRNAYSKHVPLEERKHRQALKKQYKKDLDNLVKSRKSSI